MAIIHILDKNTDKIIGTLNHLKAEYRGAVRKDSLEAENTFDFIANARLPKVALLEKRTRLAVQDEDGFFREFIITYAEQYQREEKRVRADASFIDLAKSKVIDPQELTGATALTAVQTALEGTEWQAGDIEYADIRTITIGEYTNPLALLKVIAAEFGLEIGYRVEVSGNKIVGRYVDMKEQIAGFAGKEITFAKDLVGVIRKEDSNGIVTALLGVGPEKDDGTRLTAVVEDADALQRWGRNGSHLIEVYEVDSTDETLTEEQIRDLTEAELAKRIDAIVSYECEAVSLEHIFGREHEKIRIGQTVRIKDDGYNPPLYVEGRIQEVEVDPTTNEVLNFKIGNFIEFRKSDLEKQIAALRGVISDKISRLILSTIDSSNGNVFKNGAGSTVLTAKVFLAGTETDLDGSKYSYKWSKIDKDGAVVGGYNKTTKSVTVTSAEITEKATFVLEVSSDKFLSTSQITITAVNDGQSLYTWVKYASDINGTGISDDPTGKGYIGFAYNKTSPIESDNPADYTWNAVEGSQGVPGTSYYTWLKYATTPTTGMSDSPTGKLYMGLAHNKTSPTESSNYADYTWSLIKGDKGDKGDTGSQGIPGPPGDNGESLYTWIKYADTDTGTGMADSPTGKKYMGLAYNKTSSTESAIASDYTWSLIEGPQGTKGDDGITYYTWVKYANDANGTGMSDSPTGKIYMGIAYNKTTATESTTAADYSWSLIQGPQGIPGEPGEDGTTYYTWIKYADSATTGMSDTPTNKKYIGIAVNKTTATESSNYADYTWALIKGDQGIPGEPGADGVTTYTWVKYADDSSGTGMSDSPTGKRYLGLAYNKTTATESTNAADYSWSPLYDNVEVGGTNIFTDYYLQRVVTNNATNGTITRTVDSPTNLIKMTSSGAGTYFGFNQASTDRKISFESGENYVFSFEARGNVANFDYTYMMRNSAEGINSSYGTKSVTLSTTEWTKVIMYKNAPWSTDTGYTLIGSRDVGADKWFEVRKVQMEKGNVATDWSPNPNEPQTFTWTMYADDKDGTNMTTNPAGRFWRGVAYNKTSPTPSTTASEYTWSFITDGWVKSGTVKMDGGNIYADSLSVISANMGTVTAGELQGVLVKLGQVGGNGDLQVWADTDGDGVNEVVGQVNTNGGFFPYLKVDELVANVENTYQGPSKNVYFDSASGNDANSGASWATAKKNIKGYINSLPKNLNGYYIQLNFRGNINGGIDFNGFHNGEILLVGDTSTTRYKIYGYIRKYNNAAVRILCQGFDLVYDATANNQSRLIELARTDHSQFSDVKCYGGNACNHAFYLSASKAYITDCHAYNILDRGIFAERNSWVYFTNCKGVTPVAVLSDTGSMVTGAGTRWSGSLVRTNNGMLGAVTASGTGGVSGTSWTHDVWAANTGDVAPPNPAPPARQTISIAASTGDNYSTQGFWTNDDVKQGDYGYGNRTGIWYFDFSALEGKTIESATMTIYRNKGVGASAGRTLRLVSAANNTRATRTATVSGSNVVTASIAQGATITVDIKTLLQSNIVTGSHTTIGCYTTTGSTDYMSLGATPTINVTYY
jgi:phage minor structural protein